jgi:hypothetical protein
MPVNCSPSSSRATWPPRDSRTRNTVTQLVTATHNHARLSPCRPLVSSRCATTCACTKVRASSTGAAKRYGCRLFQLTDRAHTHRHAEYLRYCLLRRALRQAIRPRTQRHCRLDAGTVCPTGYSCGLGHARRLTAYRTHQLMPLILRDHRPDRQNLNHLMAPRGGIISREGRLAVWTLRRLENHDLMYVFHRDQGARMAGMA